MLLFAIILDPRYKLDYVTFFIGEMFGETKVEEVAKGIKGIMSRLYEFYLRDSHKIANNQVFNDAPLVNVVDVEKENGDKDFHIAMLLKLKKMKENVHSLIKK